MDSIFGEVNHLCTFAWEKRYSPPPDTKDIGYLHESILAYRASSAFVRNLLPMTTVQSGRYKNPDNDLRGPWKSMDYTCRYTADERPNLYYPIKQPNTGEEIWPKRTRVWGMSRAVHERNMLEDRIWWGVNGTNTVPALKNFLAEIQQGMMPVSLLKYDVVGHTDEAAKELRKYLPEIKFTPKPTRLIQHLLRIATKPDDLVLDFFAGSGTTAHAVMKLNAEDGGKRRFILVSSTEATEEQIPPSPPFSKGGEKSAPLFTKGGADNLVANNKADVSITMNSPDANEETKTSSFTKEDAHSSSPPFEKGG